MVEEWTTCMRLLSWRRHQGTMLKNCVLILPVSDPAKQAVQVVKHHMIYVRYFSILLYLLNVQVAPTENKTSLKL